MSLDFLHIEFLAPQWLWLLWLVPAIIWWFFHLDNQKRGFVKFSRLESDQKSLHRVWIDKLRKTTFIANGLMIAFIILALSKPFFKNTEEGLNFKYKYGIDLILAMDVSASMLARDFEPDRLAVSKEMAKKFVDSRFGDRIGLVIYEGEAITACPATLDHEVLKNQIDLIQPGNLEPGTAIGTGLGTAVTRLRSDLLKSKVIVLLTDGSNNSGSMTPETAATLAKEKHIRVYTIGIGTNGMAPTPVMTPFGIEFQETPVEIDENTLQNIAEITGGKYFRATDEAALKSIYDEINRLEKRKIKDTEYNAEPPYSPAPFVIIAFLLFFYVLIVNRIVFKINEY
jgi:Ca-activated chloride channel family protein